MVGPPSIWGAINSLDPVRIRHGITAVKDPALMQEIRDRDIVLDVCPVSNLRTRAVASPAAHPLPQLVAFGIPCSISTDDPEMFDTDLTRDYELATSFGIPPRTFFEAALKGALCEPELKSELAAIGQAYPWPAPDAGAIPSSPIS